MHGDIRFISLHDRHPRHIHHQQVGESPGPRGAYHLLGDKRYGHRCLLHAFRLLGGGGDGGSLSALQLFDEVSKAERVRKGGSIVGVLLQQQRGISGSLQTVVFFHIAEREQMVGGASCPCCEARHVVGEHFHGFVKAADVVGCLRLSADFHVGGTLLHIGYGLAPCCDAEDDSGDENEESVHGCWVI